MTAASRLTLSARSSGPDEPDRAVVRPVKWNTEAATVSAMAKGASPVTRKLVP